MFKLQLASTDKDFVLVRNLAEEIWPGVYGTILSNTQIAYMIELMYAKPIIAAEVAAGIKYYLAMSGKTPAGYLSFGQSADDPETLKLHKLYLHKEFRGNGFGKKMIQFAIEQARQDGYKKLKLNVNKNNAASIAVYKKCGLTMDSAVTVDIGNSFFMDDYVFSINL